MEGYSKLANLMGDDRTDGHYLIFQKFESISAQNLLYLQAEIINLKENLDKIAEINSKSEDPQKQKFTQDWEVLSSSEDNVEWRKWLEIRCKLEEYYKAIAHHRMITGLPAPSSYDLNFIQEWLQRPRLGNCAFTGADCDVYDPHNCNGLITLASGGGQMDAMTRLLVNVLPNIYHWGFVHPIHRICGRWIKKPECHQTKTDLGSSNSEDECNTKTSSNCPPTTGTSSASSTLHPNISHSSTTESSTTYDLESNIFLYRDTHFHRIATVLGTLISSLIPIAAIIILYFVGNMTARLGIVSAFTAVFSVCLSLVTEAKRVENFAATAAFASVQVVFVGSTNWSVQFSFFSGAIRELQLRKVQTDHASEVAEGFNGKAEQAIDQTHALVAAISRGLGDNITPGSSMSIGKQYTAWRGVKKVHKLVVVNAIPAPMILEEGDATTHMVNAVIT